MRNNYRKRRDEIHAKCGGRCGYCGREISLKEMQIDHMWPKCRGGSDEMENLLPSCGQCNHYKRSLTVDGFRDRMLSLDKRISQMYTLKVAVKFGIAIIKPFDGAFYFEKLKDDLK